MSYGESLLSKVIDANDPSALVRFGVESEHFATPPEREAYRFIRDYAEANRGQAPDYRTLVAEIDGFTYMPNVEDSFEWMTTRLKKDAAKRQLYEYLTGTVSVKFDAEKDGEKLISDLISDLESIKLRTHVRSKVGTDVKRDTEKFLEEYRKRKSGESVRIWKSRFPSIDREIGGYASSNVFSWFGRSGRGKSVFTLEEAIESALQGANVLLWTMEMGWFEVMVRIYVSISGREGVVPAGLTDIDMDAGFDAKKIRHGKLSDEFEDGFRTFLSTLDQIISGNITIRAVDDEDFVSRNLRQLEADILATKADVVVLDPFYYLDYEKNTSKTAGGDAAETSKKLRRLAGKTRTVIHAITQADEDAKEGDGDERELKLPKRADVKKTKALLEDAANLFAIDTLNHEGRGMIGLGKGRDGGEGATVEVVYLPNFGIVREMETGEASVKQFEKTF
jgi:replicative DNA helicase